MSRHDLCAAMFALKSAKIIRIMQSNEFQMELCLCSNLDSVGIFCKKKKNHTGRQYLICFWLFGFAEYCTCTDCNRKLTLLSLLSATMLCSAGVQTLSLYFLGPILSWMNTAKSTPDDNLNQTLHCSLWSVTMLCSVGIHRVMQQHWYHT